MAPTPLELAQRTVCHCGLQELLGANEHKQVLLQAIWQAFLVLAEHCMKVRPCSCWQCGSAAAAAAQRQQGTG